MKKYAILGHRLQVFRVIESETEPQHASRFEEITEEQAQTIADGSGHFLIDGNLIPVQEHIQSHRWNTETESWDFVPPPVPTEVLTYKVFGQLTKEVMQGEDEQMQAALTQAGTMTNLLMEMTKAAPEEQIPTAMKPVALNEIERTQTIQRAHPFIDLYGPAFGYVTEEEKDQFFIRAQDYKFGA